MNDSLNNNPEGIFRPSADISEPAIMADTSWNIFNKRIKEGSKDSAYPRKAVLLDADLHKTLKELQIYEDNNRDYRIIDLLNAMVRAFMEANIDNLRIYRKNIEAKSIFEHAG